MNALNQQAPPKLLQQSCLKAWCWKSAVKFWR